MDGDRPILDRADDRLGFAPIAEHLSKAILDQSSRDGFVVGVNGQWGSGKSTLLNLTMAELRNGPAKPTVVLFSPWLVGARDILLRELFDELAAAALTIEPIRTSAPTSTLQRLVSRLWSRQWRARQKERSKKKLARKLHAFGLLAGGASVLAESVGAFGVPGASGAASVATKSKEALLSFLAGGALSKRKAEIVTLLSDLSRPIVVFVDDLDRLEPREAIEVLRLIRAVADFPNVIYVVSYDASVVASTLNSVLQIADGHEYLEKIVQVSFSVPTPEAFDLRNWFRFEINKMFPRPPISDSEDDQLVTSAARLEATINSQGGTYLRTPRDVVRVLNALRLHTIPVRDLIDVPDMVWLQLTKIGNAELYRWVEEYLCEVTAIANGAYASGDEAKDLDERLDQILKEEGGDVGRKLIELSHILPGIDPGPIYGNSSDKARVLKTNLLVDHLINPLIANKRLGSPQHYRYYFSFAEPAGALRDEIVRKFLLQAENDPDAALTAFAELATKHRPQGGLMVDVLIDRLTAITKRISGTALQTILRCFTETMDSIARSSSSSDFGIDRTWHRAQKLTEMCLKNVPAGGRDLVLSYLFQQGKSIGWLTDILRHEIFSHGYFGERKTSESEWLLSAEEFDAARTTMLERYRSEEPGKLINTPNFLSLLYGWQQGGGGEEVRKWVAAQTTTDTGLLAILPRMRSMAYRNIVSYPLNKSDIERFFDYDIVRGRIQSIIDSSGEADPDKTAALDIMKALYIGENNRE